MNYNDLLREIKESIIFTNEDDEENFDFYLSQRGLSTYKLALDALKIYKNEKITYNEFSSFIRYDKSIRDLIYIYLGTFEESLKERIFLKIDYLGKDVVRKFNKSQNFKILDTNSYSLNFAKKCEMTLEQLKNLLTNFSDSHIIDLNELEKIIELRNNVMHHQMILIDKTIPINKDNLSKRKNIIKDQILTLVNNLNDNYKDSLLKSIKNLNKYNPIIKLDI